MRKKIYIYIVLVLCIGIYINQKAIELQSSSYGIRKLQKYQEINNTYLGLK